MREPAGEVEKSVSETEGLEDRGTRRAHSRAGFVRDPRVRTFGCRKGLRLGGRSGEEMFCSIEPMDRRLYLRTSVSMYMYICVIAMRSRMLAVMFCRWSACSVLSDFQPR